MTVTTKTPVDKDQAALVEQRAQLIRWAAAHAELIDAGATAAQARTSHEEGDALRKTIADLEGKVARAAGRAREVQEAEEARGRAAAWSTVERLLRERHKVAQALQQDLSDAMASLHELIELNQRAYDAIPEADRPSLRPNITLPGAIVRTAELFVFARSAGLMCKQGMSPHSAGQRPDIVTASQQLGEFILSRRAAP